MALFSSSFDALAFAYRFDGTNVKTVRIGEIPAAGTGKGLSGLDGAAEAGNIKRIVDKQAAWIGCIIRARFMLPRVPCECRRPCCKGWMVSDNWRAAVREIAQYSEMKDRCFSGSGDVIYRTEIVARYFQRAEDKEALADIAARARVSDRTARTHYNLVHAMLHGTSASVGIEQLAMEYVDRSLMDAGIVGAEDDGFVEM